MGLWDILSAGIGALILVIVSHFAVFWVVKTMYPPPPQVVMVAAPAAPVFTPPPVQTQDAEQHVELPTYAPSVPVEAPSEERKGPPPPEATSIRGKPGVDSPNAQRAGAA